MLLGIMNQGRKFQFPIKETDLLNGLTAENAHADELAVIQYGGKSDRLLDRVGHTDIR